MRVCSPSSFCVLLHGVGGEGGVLSAEAVCSLAIQWGYFRQRLKTRDSRLKEFICFALCFSQRFLCLLLTSYFFCGWGMSARVTGDADLSSPSTVSEKADPRRERHTAAYYPGSIFSFLTF